MNIMMQRATISQAYSFVGPASNCRNYKLSLLLFVNSLELTVVSRDFLKLMREPVWPHASFNALHIAWQDVTIYFLVNTTTFTCERQTSAR